MVSVITIFLNAQAFLEESIASVLAQSYDNWELILVDDGSSDGSTGLAREYASRFPDRIRYLEHPGHANLGMSASRNAGIRESRGDYIALLDADDVWLPGKLATQVALLDDHPEVSLVFGPTLWWHDWSNDAASGVRDFVTALPARAERDYPGRFLLARILSQRADPIYTCSVLLRRSAVQSVGGFEPRFRGLFEDQAFFAKILLDYRAYITAECLDRYRQHAGSCCGEAAGTASVLSPKMRTARAEYLRWLASYVNDKPQHTAFRRQIAREIWLTRWPALMRTRFAARNAAHTISGTVTTYAFAVARRVLPASVRMRLWRHARRPYSGPAA